MTPSSAAILGEIDQESQATRRVLERVPEDRLEWRAHPKSMALGQLAMHVAALPGGIAGMLSTPELDVATADFRPAQPSSRAELMAAFEDALERARKLLGDYDQAFAEATWRMHRGGQTMLAAPRLALLRSLLCNHLYHHRGQLTVYLRLLEVPLPSVYGPSADSNPFSS